MPSGYGPGVGPRRAVDPKSSAGEQEDDQQSSNHEGGDSDGPRDHESSERSVGPADSRGCDRYRRLSQHGAEAYCE